MNRVGWSISYKVRWLILDNVVSQGSFLRFELGRMEYFPLFQSYVETTLENNLEVTRREH
jgi:hypothetical protein